jgi:hypothetical protein
MKQKSDYRPAGAVGALGGVAILIKMGQRGKAKVPATSSITLTWQV